VLDALSQEDVSKRRQKSSIKGLYVGAGRLVILEFDKNSTDL